MYRASPFGLIVVRFPLDFSVGITPQYRPGMRLQMWSGLYASISQAKASSVMHELSGSRDFGGLSQPTRCAKL